MSASGSKRYRTAPSTSSAPPAVPGAPQVRRRPRKRDGVRGDPGRVHRRPARPSPPSSAVSSPPTGRSPSSSATRSPGPVAPAATTSRVRATSRAGTSSRERLVPDPNDMPQAPRAPAGRSQVVVPHPVPVPDGARLRPQPAHRAAQPRRAVDGPQHDRLGTPQPARRRPRRQGAARHVVHHRGHHLPPPLVRPRRGADSAQTSRARSQAASCRDRAEWLDRFEDNIVQNPAGAPPLDWWDDDYDPADPVDAYTLGHMTLVQATQPYKGSRWWRAHNVTRLSSACGSSWPASQGTT
jgi:hypothetical protein